MHKDPEPSDSGNGDERDVEYAAKLEAAEAVIEADGDRHFTTKL
jgi:hypothetical protein